jgi:hypothetical protein
MVFCAGSGLTGRTGVVLPRSIIKEGQQMVIRKSLVSLAAAGLVLGSTAAAAAPTTTAREGSPVAKSDNLAGIGTFGILIGVVILAGVIAIIASDKHHHPKSP